jgi:hypothetical protein
MRAARGCCPRGGVGCPGGKRAGTPCTRCWPASFKLPFEGQEGHEGRTPRTKSCPGPHCKSGRKEEGRRPDAVSYKASHASTGITLVSVPSSGGRALPLLSLSSRGRPWRAARRGNRNEERAARFFSPGEGGKERERGVSILPHRRASGGRQAKTRRLRQSYPLLPS